MLYILRHGKTEWNAKKLLQGQCDIPLNEEGINMAIEAGCQNRDVHFDICFSSPLIRARETARLFLEGRDVPIEYDDRLKEMAFGKNEGVVYSVQKDSGVMSVFFNDPPRYVPAEGGETFDELFARTGEILREKIMPAVDVGKDVLIVGHGAMNSSIICQVKGMPLERFWDAGLDNCKLLRII